jgi:hypothetical protein
VHELNPPRTVAICLAGLNPLYYRPIPLPSFLSREPKPLLANMIEFEKLKDSNWGQWKMFMKALLVRKGLWDVVDGTEVLPAGSSSHKSVKRSKPRLSPRSHFMLMWHNSALSRTTTQNCLGCPCCRSSGPWHGHSTHLTPPISSFAKARRTNAEFYCRLAQLLQEIGVTVDDEDIILVLTGRDAKVRFGSV